MRELYYPAYNILLAEAHNDARALISRHIKEDANQVVRLTIFGDDLGFDESSVMAGARLTVRNDRGHLPEAHDC